MSFAPLGLRVRVLAGLVGLAALSSACGGGRSDDDAASASPSSSSPSTTIWTDVVVDDTTTTTAPGTTTSSAGTSSVATKPPATARPAPTPTTGRPAPTTTTTRATATPANCPPAPYRVDAAGLWNTPAGGKATLVWKAPPGRDRAIRSVTFSPDGKKIGFTYVRDDGRRGFATVNRDGTGFFAPPNDDWPAGVTGLTWSLRNQPVAVTARPPTGTDTHHYDLIFEYGPTPDKVAGLEYAAGQVAGIEVRPGSGEIVFLNEYGVVLNDLSRGIHVQHKVGSGGPADVERRKLSVSPDGAWAAVIVDGQRMLVDLAGGTTVALGPATPADMVGPWSADGSVVGYLGRQAAGDAGTVTAYRRDGGVAWTRPGAGGDPGFLATGWGGTKLCR